MSEFGKLRKISPLGFRVVVRIETNSDKTETGLYLPEGAKEKMSESILAQVTDVASAADEDDDLTNVSGIPLGARVLIKKDAGVKVPWDDTLRIIETQEVLAMVEEISIS